MKKEKKFLKYPSTGTAKKEELHAPFLCSRAWGCVPLKAGLVGDALRFRRMLNAALVKGACVCMHVCVGGGGVWMRACVCVCVHWCQLINDR